MSRISAWGISAFFCIALGASIASAQAPRPSETVFPDTTRGFAAIANVDNFDAQWNRTQIGKLLADPAMKPFEDDLRQQLQNSWSGIRERLNLTLQDLRDVAGGEVGLGLVQLIAVGPDKKPKTTGAAVAVLIDATGRLPRAQKLIERLKSDLLKKGATPGDLAVGEATVSAFVLPAAKEEELPAAREGQPAAAPAGPPMPTRIAFALVGPHLVVSDSVEVTQGMVKRLLGAKGDSLADVTGFRTVMKRCTADAPGAAHQMRWYVYPLGYAEAARAALPKEKRRNKKTILEVIRNQGVGAILGVGGFLDVAENSFELVHRTAVYAPKPYKNAMKMMVLPNAADFTPQPWIPKDVANYTTLYVDILNAFDNFGPLFDELFGEGETGIWDQVIDQLKNDPTGPHIDLREEFIKHLGQRVTMASDYELPITTTSERLLFAVEATDPAAVEKALEKCVKNDPSIKRRVIGKQVIWEIVEEAPPAVPDISLGGEVPSLGAKKEPSEDESEPGEKKKEHILPHGAITVAHGHLLVASHLDFLLKVLNGIRDEDRLSKNAEYLRVAGTIQKLGFPKQCAAQFSRADAEIYPTYELIRRGEMPQSQTLLGRALNSMSGATKKGVVRQQKIKGGKLPPFDKVVRPSLGTGGGIVVSEPDGWFIKGFLLPRAGEAARPAKAAKPADSDAKKG